MYHGIKPSFQKLQVCRQQQIAPGNKTANSVSKHLFFNSKQGNVIRKCGRPGHVGGVESHVFTESLLNVRKHERMIAQLPQLDYGVHQSSTTTLALSDEREVVTQHTI